MNTVLWILQVLLALHTIAGALWKFSSSEQSVPSLHALPHAAWLGLSVLELLASLALIAPAVNKRNRRLGTLAVAGALLVAAEMLLFCGLHLTSGVAEHGEMIYWLVVAAICAFIAYGRLVLKPL